MSVVTRPTPLRTPPEPRPKVWLEAPPISGDLSGEPASGGRTLGWGASGMGAASSSAVVDDVWRTW